MKYGLLIFVLFLVITSSLFAQEDSTAVAPNKQVVLLSGGISFPSLPEEFNTNFMNGWNVGGGVGLMLPSGSLGYSTVYISAEFNQFKFDEKEYLKTVDTNLIQANPGFTAYQRPAKVFVAMINYQGTFTVISDVISPYFVLGVGFMSYSIPALITTPSTSLNQDSINKSMLVWSLGIGLDVPVTESIGAFVQAKSLLGAGDQQRQCFPVVVGVHYSL